MEPAYLPLAPAQSVRLSLLEPADAARSWARIVTEAPYEGPTTVAFINMRYFVEASRSRLAPSAFASMDFVCPDGVGIQMARWFTRLPRFERVSGTDTVPLLLAELPAGTRVYLLGGPLESLPRLRASFVSLFPHLALAGTHHGFFAEHEEERVAATISQADPDLVLVGMGSPAQELWMQRNRHLLTARLAICVGGLFQYWIGDLRRAPRLARVLGLEWLCILVQQPFKWRIFTVDAVRFFVRLLRLRRTIQ